MHTVLGNVDAGNKREGTVGHCVRKGCDGILVHYDVVIGEQDHVVA